MSNTVVKNYQKQLVHIDVIAFQVADYTLCPQIMTLTTLCVILGETHCIFRVSSKSVQV